MSNLGRIRCICPPPLAGNAGIQEAAWGALVNHAEGERAFFVGAEDEERRLVIPNKIGIKSIVVSYTRDTRNRKERQEKVRPGA